MAMTFGLDKSLLDAIAKMQQQQQPVTETTPQPLESNQPPKQESLNEG